MIPKCKPPFKYNVGDKVRVKSIVGIDEVEESGDYTDEEIHYLRQAIRHPAKIMAVKKCVCNFPYQLHFDIPIQPVTILFGENELESIEIKVDDNGNLV